MSYVAVALIGCGLVAFVVFGRDGSAEVEYTIRIHGLAGDGVPGGAGVEVAPVGGVTPIGGE